MQSVAASPQLWIGNPSEFRSLSQLLLCFLLFHPDPYLGHLAHILSVLLSHFLNFFNIFSVTLSFPEFVIQKIICSQLFSFFVLLFAVIRLSIFHI